MGNAFSFIEMHKEGWDQGHHAITKPHQSPADAPPHDMTLPLSHYFISSGHNSYLLGNQLNSSSGVKTIEKCLKKNCRVIELDVYNQQGDFSGPVCKHGGTLTAPVAFKDCIEAVAKHAFENSPYPVIITLENHTDDANQAVMAEILISCLGQALYIPNADEELKGWKSPEELKHKVLIRANPGKSAPELKRLIYIHNTKFKSLKEANDAGQTSSSSFDEVKAKKLLKKAFEESGLPTKATANASQSSKKMALSASGKVPGKPKPVKGAVPADSMRLPKPGPEQARVKAGALLEKPDDDVPEEALNSVYSLGELYAYTSTNLMRVYPGGMRVDSSNYNPTHAWSAGASFVALNWQTWDQALWLNSALFAMNGGCGYVLKPKWMRSLRESINGGAGTSQTNPLPEPANRTLSVTVHSAYVQQSGRGKFACLKDDVYVQVEVLGMPMDNQQQKSPVAQNTGRLMVNETYTFNVAYPEMAILLLKVKDEDLPGATQMDNLLGHWEVALSNLSEGTFKVTLQDRKEKHRHDRWIKITVQWLTPDMPPSSPGAPSPIASLPAANATSPAAHAAGLHAGAGAVASQPVTTTAGAGAGANQVVNPLSAGVPVGAAGTPPDAERVSTRERKRME